MKIEEQLVEILKVQSTDRFYSFLKELNSDQKKSLTSTIKDLYKKYTQFGDTGGGSWGHIKGTDKQRRMLETACFVCYNRADYQKTELGRWKLREDSLKDVIDWYVPVWFSDFVNKLAEQEFFSLEYDWIMRLKRKGALEPSKQLIVQGLTGEIFEYREQVNYCKPEKLLKYEETLKEHIWYLFELASNIHHRDRYYPNYQKDKKEHFGWKTTFKQYSTEGRIDRQRLLKESLLASNKNFDKLLSGWFIQLFDDLEPTAAELLLLQKDLFSTLNSPLSKVVNTSLQMIKIILGEKDFEVSEFLEIAPVLIASSTKATVNSSLIVLDKISRKNKQYNERIASLCCQAFMHPDDELQTKAAKLINTLIKDGKTLQQDLETYHGSLMTGARTILQPLLVHVPVTTIVQNVSMFDQADEKQLTAIPEIQNVDDLIFLASQVFDNNEPWHLECFVASLVKLHPTLKPEQLPLFEPAFQRALKTGRTGLRSNMGLLESLLVMFFADYGNHLIRNYPGGAPGIKELFKTFDRKDGQVNRTWTHLPRNSSYMEEWKPDSNEDTYKIHQYILLMALEKIKQGDDLPVLSKPSHAPGWILPETLIERLKVYQNSGKEPDYMDLQIAISRCWLRSEVNNHRGLLKNLSGEYNRLLNFLLTEDAEPEGPFVHKTAWMAASLAKKIKRAYPAFADFSYANKPIDYYTGNLTWEVKGIEYTESTYDYNVRGYVPTKKTRNDLRIFRKFEEKRESGFKKFFSNWFSKPVKELPFLFDWQSLKPRYLSMEYNDVKRLLLLAPNNPGPLLIDICHQCLGNPIKFGETDKKMLISTLQLLYEIWDNYGEMAHLIVGASMIRADKTAANIAAEIWINGGNKC